MFEKFCVGLVAGTVMVLALVGLTALAAVPEWLLWNALVPDLFHGPTMTFVQAWGFGLLVSLLVKSGSSK